MIVLKILIKYHVNINKFETKIPNTNLVLVFFSYTYQIFAYRLTSLEAGAPVPATAGLWRPGRTVSAPDQQGRPVLADRRMGSRLCTPVHGYKGDMEVMARGTYLSDLSDLGITSICPVFPFY